MTPVQYWLELFTTTTWQEFLNAGAEVSGFKMSQWKSVQQMQSGDTLLAYLTGVSRWIAILAVQGQPYQDNSRIWTADIYPCRVPVKIIASLTPETAIPILSMREQLTIFRNLKNPSMWSGSFRGSPRKWKEEDGKLIVSAVVAAKERT